MGTQIQIAIGPVFRHHQRFTAVKFIDSYHSSHRLLVQIGGKGNCNDGNPPPSVHVERMRMSPKFAGQKWHDRLLLNGKNRASGRYSSHLVDARPVGGGYRIGRVRDDEVNLHTGKRSLLINLRASRMAAAISAWAVGSPIDNHTAPGLPTILSRTMIAPC
jgi:hypothetical protein